MIKMEMAFAVGSIGIEWPEFRMLGNEILLNRGADMVGPRQIFFLFATLGRKYPCQFLEGAPEQNMAGKMIR